MFGSTVRREDTDDSDIDLVYEEMDANKIPSRWFWWVYMFLRKKCNAHIDLIAKNEIIDDLKRFIYNDMQLIW